MTFAPPKPSFCSNRDSEEQAADQQRRKGAHKVDARPGDVEDHVVLDGGLGGDGLKIERRLLLDMPDLVHPVAVDESAARLQAAEAGVCVVAFRRVVGVQDAPRGDGILTQPDELVAADHVVTIEARKEHGVGVQAALANQRAGVRWRTHPGRKGAVDSLVEAVALDHTADAPLEQHSTLSLQRPITSARVRPRFHVRRTVVAELNLK